MPAPSAASAVLHRLLAATCSAPATCDHDARDLGGAAPIAGLAAPWLATRLAAAGVDAQRAERVRSRLARLAGRLGAPTAFACDHAAALRRAAARARPGRAIVVGRSPLQGPAVVHLPLGAFTEAMPQLADASVLVVEPWLARPDDATALRELLAAAKARGATTIVDEAHTALRAAATTMTTALGLAADAVVFGPGLAANLPFAAIVGADGPDDAMPTAAALAVAEAMLADDGEAAHAAVAARVASLQAAVAAAAVREQLAVTWAGPATMPQLGFAGQEDAPGSLIDEHFGRELAALGCRRAGPLAPVGDAPADVDRAFVAALARIRVLLVEYNSYLSGELPFAFPGGDPTLRARGACIYRFPRRGKVRVSALSAAGGIRIAFAAGALGGVTSSGFYLPTALRGDVDATARYTLHRWSAGPDSSCLGLFLQNAASTARYYAQLMSTAEAPLVRKVAAGLAGAVSPRQQAPADNGWLRIQRRGDMVRASHRATADAPWTLLGECAGVPADDLFVGAKIWSKDRTDGLVADIEELTIVGVVAPEQQPLLGPVPDPNGQPPAP